MRAEEMTVGLEICNLENLRIFNGYDVPRKERKASNISNPSSPEDSQGGGRDEDGSRPKAKGQHSPRQRCGRPSNPVPRHKRDSHIRAEYKRRDKIQKGFETLKFLVPELSNIISSKESKSSILFKTAEHCRGLKADCGQSQNEAAALRLELEALGSEIHNLQEKLPDHGLKETVEPVQDLDSLYEEYVREETNKNWKFWIFSFFMRPMYKSYRSMMSGKMNQFEFAQATNEWITDTMSLASLRKSFLETFRKFSTQTSILNNPSKLEEEAYEAVNKSGKVENLVVKQSPPSPKPEIPRITTSPVSFSATPGYVPMTTATSFVPEVHSMGTGAAKGKQPMSPPATTEVPRSGRSRPSTPPPAVVKQRRRSRSRSEVNRTKIVEKSQPMDVAENHSAVVPGSGTKILRMMLDNKMPKTSANSSVAAGNIDSPTNNPFDLVSFVNTVNSPSPVMSTQLWTHVTATTEPDLVTKSEPVSCHGNIFTTSYNTQRSSVFLPLDSSASITNGQIVQFDQLIDSSETQSLIPDISCAMDTTAQPESYDLDNLSIYTTAQPTVISHHSPLSANHNSYISPSDQSKPVKQELFNSEEDSLTSMLSIDLMDVNSVLTFLDQDHAPATSSHGRGIASS